MKNYEEDTAFIDMLQMQLQFQRKMLEKRGIITPDDVRHTSVSKLYEACYHSACTNVEFAELLEQFHNDQAITDNVRLELTDAFIFFLNQILYMNLTPTKTLKYYYLQARCNTLQKTLTEEYLCELIGKFTCSMGAVLHKTRYKTWKEYSELDENLYELIELLDNAIVDFLRLYVAINMSIQDIYNYFMIKFNVNVERQNTGGKYEK